MYACILHAGTRYACMYMYTVIRENFGHFVQSDEKFSCENSLPVLTYSTANIIWRALEVDENNITITRIFLIQKFCERN